MVAMVLVVDELGNDSSRAFLAWHATLFATALVELQWQQPAEIAKPYAAVLYFPSAFAFAQPRPAAQNVSEHFLLQPPSFVELVSFG